jgi:hypothetical protein
MLFTMHNKQNIILNHFKTIEKDLKQFAEQLVNLTVKEVNELATILKDEYGLNQLLQL